MRILGVDYGSKRVGLALSDESGMIAQGIGYIGPSPAEVLRVAAARGAGQIVIGIPRRLDGTDSPQTTKARAFMAALQQGGSLPVIGWDERLTTAEATRVLVEAEIIGWRIPSALPPGPIGRIGLGVSVGSFISQSGRSAVPPSTMLTTSTA